MPKNQEYALTVPLGLVCGVLLIALLLEILLLQHSGAGGAKPAGVSGQDAPPGAVEPEEAFALPPVDEFSAFVERPLFVEGRKPPPPEAEQPKANEDEEATPLTLSLMGVMLTPNGELAILAEASGKNRRVRKGGTLGGWRLVDIRSDHATLQRGDERRDLPLMKPKPKKGSPPGGAPGQGPVPGGPPAGFRGGPHPPGGMPPDVSEPEPEVEEMEDVSEPADDGMPEGEE